MIVSQTTGSKYCLCIEQMESMVFLSMDETAGAAHKCYQAHAKRRLSGDGRNPSEFVSMARKVRILGQIRVNGNPGMGQVIYGQWLGCAESAKSTCANTLSYGDVM